MRFMMMMIPEVYQGKNVDYLRADFAPPKEAVDNMNKYNEALANAGALISLDGLHPPTKGVRVSYKGGKPKVTDGPFTESKEILGGYWLIKANSRQEAIDWAKKVPAEEGDVVEVRQIFDIEDFPEDVQKAGRNRVVEEAIRKQGRK